MEKYILGKNIIITTKERYEKTFKDLGYKPYQKAPLDLKRKEYIENDTKNEEIKPERQARKRKVKED